MLENTFKKIRLLSVSRNWQHYAATHAVTLEDGSHAAGFLMRCRNGDRIIYRRATAEEIEAAEWAFAIR